MIKLYVKQLLAFVMLLCSVVSMAHDLEYNGIYYQFVSAADYTIAVTYKGNSYDEYSGEYSGVVTIPASIDYYGTTYKVVRVDVDAFRNCAGLAAVTIGANVSSFGVGGFYGCTALTSIKVVSENPYFDSRNNCNAIIETKTNTLYAGCRNTKIPANVTSIGDYAFYACTGLTSITIPNSVTTIGSSAFHYCTGLTSITIPNSVTSLGDYAFSRCSNLTSVTIPNSVTTIGSSAFSGCTGLTSITIPNSVTSIGQAALYGCTGLASITIPNSVTSIGDYAFYNCIALKTVYNFSSLSLSKGDTNNGYVANYADKVINAPGGSIEGDFVFGVVDGVNTLCGYIGNGGNISLPANSKGGNYVIGAGVFNNNTTITGITIPVGVTSIGNNAFYNCTGLTSITIPNSVTSIGQAAFYGCTGLTSITIPNSVTSIGGSAFSCCTGLTSITIPNSVTSIGGSAFDGCAGLTSITIPNSVTSIGQAAFYGCTGLTNITIPNSVTSLGSYAFSGCSNLASVTIGNSVTSLGDYAFRGCSSLTNVTIGNSVTSIGYYAFYGCTGLTSITIPNSVKYIENNVFRDCANLKKIKIEDGESVLYLGYLVAYGQISNFAPPLNLTSLNDLYLGRDVEIYDSDYGGHSFNFSIFKPGIYSITIGSGVTYLYDLPNRRDLTKIVVEKGNPIYDSRDNCNAIIETKTNTLVLGCRNTTIPAGVTSIADEAFYGCTGLKSITIPASVTNIGNTTFKDCSSLKTVYNFSSLSLSKGDTNNGYVANYADKVINAPGGSIEGDFVFGVVDGVNTLCGYIGNGGNISLPANYKGGNYVIGADVFNNNTTITGITIPNSVTNVGASAFYGCTGLTSITIPNSVTSIGQAAFYGCTGLTNITIPNSVTSIGGSAFEDCFALKTVYNFSSLSLSKGDTNNGYVANYADKVINAPGGSIEGDFVFGVVGGVNTLCGYIGNAGNISLPANYKGGNYVIGADVFKNNTTITGITIPVGVTSIGDDAFYNCTGLTNITIPNSVTSIGDYAFYNCTSLKTVYNLSSLTLTAGYAANGYVAGYADKVINAPGGSIEGDFVFGVVGGVNTLCGYIGNGGNISLPANYKGGNYVIGADVFKNNTTITGITIPVGVTSIGNNAFYNCTGLRSITIPNSVTNVGASAFYGCTGLKTVYNFSSLSLSKGSTYNGYVAYYADRVINAPGGSIEGDFVFGVVGGVNTLCGYIGNGGNISLPANYKGGNYVIGADVFKNNTTITGITIPVGVTSIGNNAFYNCAGLRSITIPNSVTSVGDSAFYGCTGLTKVTIPNSVTNVGASAFYGCTGLTKVTIPGSVENIGNSAFYDCTNIKTVVNLSSLSIVKGSTDNGYVGYYANEIMTFSDDFDDVLDGYLFGKKNGELALVGCQQMDDSLLYLPRDYYGNEYVIADSALIYSYPKKWYLDIPNSVTAIGDYAFYGCFSSKPARSWELVIPASVTSIGEYAFAGCPATGTLEIPATVKSIGDGAFRACSRITDVKILTDVPAIKNEMFSACRSLKSIVIPTSVTSIGDEAFCNCESLVSIEIPNSVTSMGDSVFYGCSDLANVTIGNSVTNIGKNVFENCIALTNVEIPVGVTSIGERAFYRSANLQNVTIPASVASVGKFAFQYCDLRSLHIPASLVEIIDYAFSWNLNLSSITIDKDNPVYSVPDGYKNVIMETATNKVVFACKGAVIPETATSIGNGAFNGVGGIESITIPAGITSIGDWAFDGCQELKTIYTLSETPAELSYIAFSYDAKSTITLYVPYGAKEAYATAWGFENIVETDFTGIDGVTADGQASGSELYYDLCGRAVENPVNGIYIYKGKKVVLE